MSSQLFENKENVGAMLDERLNQFEFFWTEHASKKLLNIFQHTSNNVGRPVQTVTKCWMSVGAKVESFKRTLKDGVYNG